MYFASDDETILDIVKIELLDIQFEMQISKTFFAYGSSVYAKKHNHAHYEVFFTKECSGDMTIENEKVQLMPGSMLIVAPQMYHSYKPCGDNENKAQKYNLKFIYKESQRTNKLFENFSYKYIEDAHQLINLIEHIHAIYNSKDFASKQETESYFTILLINILRSMTKEAGEVSKEKVLKEHNSSIFEIESFFERHYDSFPSPADLAKHLCVSTRQLDRILKQLFSMSFSAKLAQTKTELAKDLLETTDMSIVKISENLGYTSPASFSASFKKQTGISPNTYRKSNR